MYRVILRRTVLQWAAAFTAAPAVAADIAQIALTANDEAARLAVRITGVQRYQITTGAGPTQFALRLPGAGGPTTAMPRARGLVRALHWDSQQHQLLIELAPGARLVRHRAEGEQILLSFRRGGGADAFPGPGRVLGQGNLRVVAGLPLVVVDPGHGGRDPGAIGAGGTQEKYITLIAAQELRRRLEASGRCRVLLTRGRDVFVPLAERVEMARRREAALFVSLHADSAPGARGASVYTLAENASDALSEGLARRENQADRAGGLRLPSVSPEVQRILLSLVRQETQTGSARMARMTVQELGDSVPLLPNTHRQASFVVLKAPDTPSILVEMGFLSDPRDEEALRRPEYRTRVTQALARAIEGWLGQGARVAPGAQATQR